MKTHHITEQTILLDMNVPEFVSVLIGSLAVGYSSTRHAIFDLLTVPPLVLEQNVPKELNN